MGQTPDRHPGPIDEDESIILEPQSTHPATNGQFSYVSGYGFRFFEEGVEKAITGGTGVQEPEFLLDCDPVAADTTYFVTYTSGKVTNERWRVTATSKTIKTADYTYAGGSISVAVTKVYASDGTTVVAQTTETYSYAGGKVTGSVLTRDV